MKTQEIINDVREYCADKIELIEMLDQLSKTQEKLTKLRDSAVRIDEHQRRTGVDYRTGANPLSDMQDGIGQTVITLIIAAELAGLKIEDCLESAWNPRIKDYAI